MLTENPSQVLDAAQGIFGNASFKAHEQVVFCQDEETGLKAIIAIHDTTLGPALAVGDLNGDQREDYVVGGAIGQPAALYLQNSDGTFQYKAISIFDNDKFYE